MAREPDADLAEFLEQVSLVGEQDEYDEEESAVTLMTLHIAKGLEFPVVFIVGMEDGIFPHYRSMTDAAELEEERRLAYVGITRAQQRLYLMSRVEPHAVRPDAVQPALAVPGRDPGASARAEGARVAQPSAPRRPPARPDEGGAVGYSVVGLPGTSGSTDVEPGWTPPRPAGVSKRERAGDLGRRHGDPRAVGRGRRASR